MNKGFILKAVGFGVTILGGVVAVLEGIAESKRQDEVIEEKVNAAMAAREEE